MGEEDKLDWSITIKPSKAVTEGKTKDFEVTVEGYLKIPDIKSTLISRQICEIKSF